MTQTITVLQGMLIGLTIGFCSGSLATVAYIIHLARKAESEKRAPWNKK